MVAYAVIVNPHEKRRHQIKDNGNVQRGKKSNGKKRGTLATLIIYVMKQYDKVLNIDKSGGRDLGVYCITYKLLQYLLS